jgi:hypothetical protein
MAQDYALLSSFQAVRPDVRLPIPARCGRLWRGGGLQEFRRFLYESFKSLIFGMEVGGRMVGMIHPDINAEKTGNDGHENFRFFLWLNR